MAIASRRGPEDLFLIVGELVPHKRVEPRSRPAAAPARGPSSSARGLEAERLAAAAGRSASFQGRVDDNELASLYKRCLALVMPNVEEFGIAAVEAQAAGPRCWP